MARDLSVYFHGKNTYLSADGSTVDTGKIREERDDLAWECQGRGKLSVENTGSHSSGSLLLHLGNPKFTDSKASSCAKTPNCHRLILQETIPTLTTLLFLLTVVKLSTWLENAAGWHCLQVTFQNKGTGCLGFRKGVLCSTSACCTEGGGRGGAPHPIYILCFP